MGKFSSIIETLKNDSQPPETEKSNGDSDRFPKNLGIQANLSLSPGRENKNFEPFPVEALPEPIQKFVREAAKSLGVDCSMIVTPVLAVLASAVGATRTIKLKRDWSEPCVLWTAILGLPGSLKSPALKIVIDLLDDIQSQAFIEYEAKRETYESTLEDFEIDFTAWKKGGRKKGEPKPSKPTEPTCKRILCRDITIEAVSKILKDNPRGILVFNDELRSWLSFDRYSNAKGSNIPHWLSMFSALPLTRDRVTGRESIHIPRAAVSITGGLQPSVLRSVLQGNSPTQSETPSIELEHINDGLLSRILLTYPPQKTKSWNESEVSENTIESLRELLRFLLSLDFYYDESGMTKPISIPLSPDGKREWVKYYNSHSRELKKLGDSPLAYHWSKLEGITARIALLIHLIRCFHRDNSDFESQHVDAESILAAIRVSQWYGDEGGRIYSQVLGDFSESEENREKRILVQIIGKNGGQISPRELTRKRKRYKTSNAAEAALRKLQNDGQGRFETYETSTNQGRVFRLL